MYERAPLRVDKCENTTHSHLAPTSRSAHIHCEIDFSFSGWRHCRSSPFIADEDAKTIHLNFRLRLIACQNQLNWNTINGVRRTPARTSPHFRHRNTFNRVFRRLNVPPHIHTHSAHTQYTYSYSFPIPFASDTNLSIFEIVASHRCDDKSILLTKRVRFYCFRLMLDTLFICAHL